MVAIETVLGRLRSEARSQIDQAGEHLRNRDVLIWMLAVCPVLILPPVLAVLMSFRSLRAPASMAGASPRFDVLVLIAAACNIILSVIFWRWLSEISMSSGLSLGVFLKSLGVPSPRSLLQSI